MKRLIIQCSENEFSLDNLNFFLDDLGIMAYRLTNWLMFLCGQIQSPRPDVMPDRRKGIARAEGFVSALIETSAS